MLVLINTNVQSSAAIRFLATTHLRVELCPEVRKCNWTLGSLGTSPHREGPPSPWLARGLLGTGLGRGEVIAGAEEVTVAHNHMKVHFGVIMNALQVVQINIFGEADNM